MRPNREPLRTTVLPRFARSGMRRRTHVRSARYVIWNCPQSHPLARRMTKPNNTQDSIHAASFISTLFPQLAALDVAQPFAYRPEEVVADLASPARLLHSVNAEYIAASFDPWHQAIDGIGAAQSDTTLEEGLNAIAHHQDALREAARIAATHSSPSIALSATLAPGTTIVSPPYDLLWTSLNGESSVSAKERVFSPGTHPLFLGRCSVPWYSSGYYLRGLGIHLRVTSPALVGLTPVGHFQSRVSAATDAHGLRIAAGMGALVYDDDSPNPLALRIVETWRVAGLAARGEVSRTGTIQDLSPPAFGLGTTPMANPMIVGMHPGRTYTFWVWSWIRGTIAPNEYAIAGMSAQMPMVIVTAGPFAIIK